MSRHRLLIVDDEPDMRNGLLRVLGKKFPAVEIVTAQDGEEALEYIHEHGADLALLDIQMPGMTGLELLKEMTSRDPWITVVMMTGFGTIATAVEAIKLGAYDFLTKPFDSDLLRRTIAKALERTRLLRENHELKQQVCDKHIKTEFVGESATMKRFQSYLNTVARSNYTTLVRGESGTGKELAARAIHSLSNRADKPLIMVNCPAIPEHLLESELFGHTRGAFTGASHEQKGLFAEADGGTICLDEVGDIPIGIQAKLLRVLQEQEIKPLGAPVTKKIDVRVIALTNLDLETMIAERLFREDLFYRLNVVTLTTPSLGEIIDDIPLLVDHLAKKVCCELDLPYKRFDQRALAALCHRNWPGNVRELQNVVRRSVMFCPGDVISIEDIHGIEPPNLSSSPGQQSIVLVGDELEPYKIAKEKIIDSFTVEYIHSILKKHNGNISQAAATSGLSRVALQKIIKRHDIDADAFRS
ncbi:sigma-54-dependent transcriptional regulator [Desulfosediminicola flagellatus]|uniref:sigma-54-dependent transcriptional regulator n=1 Tax=Desulfosediminicola flagellatus TaxID=2569541 RepID=UPI0010AC86A8|nr:sigma-54 dependent transcriptional regulator [Desulfosediminicola flagellatus]